MSEMYRDLATELGKYKKAEGQDLINKGTLLKELNEFCGQQRYLVPENVWDMIENTPIAYNSEKVVEQLEERLCSETDAVI